MVNELTPNILELLNSNDLELIDLGILTTGYNETEEDFKKLVALLKPHYLEPYPMKDMNGVRSYDVKCIIVLEMPRNRITIEE